MHAPILIGGAAVEGVKELKFLGGHISDDLSWAVCGEESTTIALLFQEAEENRCGS